MEQYHQQQKTNPFMTILIKGFYALIKHFAPVIKTIAVSILV